MAASCPNSLRRRACLLMAVACCQIAPAAAEDNIGEFFFETLRYRDAVGSRCQRGIGKENKPRCRQLEQKAGDGWAMPTFAFAPSLEWTAAP